MNLRLHHVVKTGKAKLPSDHRRNANEVVASYRGEDGREYRKAFYAIDEPPIVPDSGTSEQLNAIREQLS